MNQTGRPPISPRLLAGAILIGLGALFLLSSFGLVDAGSLFDYWPLFLIVPGAISLLWPHKPADRFWGLTLLAVGTLFLLRNLGFIWISFRHIWPIVLVALGVNLVVRALQSRPSETGQGAASAGAFPISGPSGDRLDEFAMFGGGGRVIRSQQFSGGNVTAMLGGFDIDLREAAMAGNAARLEVFVMMGGIDLKVPEDWTVALDVTPFMGGANYRARGSKPPSEGPPKVLTVSGFVFMGGIDIKH